MSPRVRITPGFQTAAVAFVGGENFLSGSSQYLLSGVFENAGTTLGTCGKDFRRLRNRQGAKWRLYGT